MQSFSAEVTSGEDEFREISFMGGGPNEEYPLSYDSKLDGLTNSPTTQPSGERYDPFDEFAIKIVMQSTNAADVPEIKDLRAIALAT